MMQKHFYVSEMGGGRKLCRKGKSYYLLHVYVIDSIQRLTQLFSQIPFFFLFFPLIYDEDKAITVLTNSTRLL